MKKAANFLLLLFLLLGAFVAGSWQTRRAMATNNYGKGHTVLYYFDPMHPAYRSDKPGVAPDCGMQLEPVYARDPGSATGGESEAASAPSGLLNLSAEKQQLFGVKVSPAEKVSGSYPLRLFGRVAPDESRIYRLNAGVEGFMQQISPVTTGSQVRKGQVLATYFSPDFVMLIQARLFAVATYEQVKKDASPDQLELNAKNVQQTYDRLRGLGMTGAQIDEIDHTRQAPRSVKILAPVDGFVLARNVSPEQRFDKGLEWYRIADLSHVWIVADVFGEQAQYLHAGARAQVTLADQKSTFSARVSEVRPQFDPAARTLKVRFEADNPGGILLPDMFVDVQLSVTLPPAIVVPADAVLDSGLRKVVFVDRGDGHFEPREVETGWRFGGRVEIARGLQAGERIVTSGNFLLDSETRMRQPAQSGGQAAGADPVCGMDLRAAKTKFDSEHGGRHYSFCSTRCRDRFAREPQRYIGEAARQKRVSTGGPQS